MTSEPPKRGRLTPKLSGESVPTSDAPVSVNVAVFALRLSGKSAMRRYGEVPPFVLR